jgi:hypothetical protein
MPGPNTRPGGFLATVQEANRALWQRTRSIRLKHRSAHASRVLNLRRVRRMASQTSPALMCAKSARSRTSVMITSRVAVCTAAPPRRRPPYGPYLSGWSIAKVPLWVR